MKILITFMMVVGLLLSNCRAQDKSENSEQRTFVQNLTAYTLDRDKMFTALPDTLGGEELQGFALLGVYIDDDGKFLGYNLLKLFLKNREGKEKLSFYNPEKPSSNDSKPIIKKGDSYPSEVKKYYKFIESYLEKVKFKRDENVEVKPVNDFAFVLRFNKSKK